MRAHALPMVGPWFEGWYTRLVDTSNGLSFGVITTSAMKTAESLTIEGSSGYIAAIVDCEELSKTISFEAFPKRTSIGNDVDGFRWSSADHGHATSGATEISIANDVKLRLKLKSRTPWFSENAQLGPEGPLAFVRAFPLHWHVWNTGGRADYEIEFTQNGKTYHYAGEGLIHQEKNWGAVFPPFWMWAQAMNEDAYFTLAGGDLKLGVLAVRAYLVGYRSANHSVDFNPAQWIGEQFKEEIDAFDKTFRFTAMNQSYKLDVELTAPNDSFANLAIPTLQGYMPNGAIESFRAQAITKLYRNTGDESYPEWTLLESQEFKQAGLEFGGLAQEPN